MKRFLPVLFAIPFSSFCQVSFTERIIDTSAGTLGISKIAPADLNNDGYVDVAITRRFSNELAFYTQNGSLNYGNKQIINSTLDYPIDVCASDFNNDGWDDLAAFDNQGKSIQVFINQNGSFASSSKIDSNSLIAPIAIFTDDFNNDNIADLLAVDDTSVSYYQNNGSAIFTKHKVAGKTEFYSGAVTDLNGDSLPDILLGSIKLYTYINNGNNTFTRDTRNEALINKFIFEIETADIDGDGDNDMAFYSSNTDPNIDWYKNDGTGKFTFGGSITTTADDVNSMRLADFTGNGKPDFVTIYGQSGKLVWIENLGTGNFGNENLLKTYPILPREVAVADADNDGDIDIYCSHNSAGIFFWENLSPHFSINELYAKANLFPNPASEVIHFQATEPSSFEIYNQAGQLLQSGNLDIDLNQIQVNLPSGMYHISWTEDNAIRNQPIIIER